MESSTKVNKRHSDSNGEPPPSKKQLRSQTSAASFNWIEDCLLCGKGANPKKGIKLSSVSQVKSDTLKEKILNAAKIRNDFSIENRLSFEGLNLYAVKAHYHKQCYQDYVSEKALNAFVKKSEVDIEQIYLDIALDTFSDYKEILDEGNLILLPEMCESFRQKVVARKIKADEEAFNIRSTFIKNKLDIAANGQLNFYSHPGKADIVASSKFSVGLILHNFLDSQKNRNENHNLFKTSERNENSIVYEAVNIIRNSIKRIPTTRDYPLPNEVSNKCSAQFVPDIVKKLISWLIHDDAFKKAIEIPDNDEYATAYRRMLSIAECIIYCARRGKEQVIPPFHHGLMLQMHHEFASKVLIETLNSYGFCSSYDELRSFLSAAADAELERNKNVYVPSGLISRDAGGKFIQEGDDNVDINTETIDGKNTYHAMARVLFQNQEVGEKAMVTRISRSSKRSLNSDNTENLFELYHYQKPKTRVEPPKFENAFSAVESFSKKCENNCVKNIVWAMLRSIPRGIFTSATGIQSCKQIIPSWKAFNAQFALSSSIFTSVQYTPALNAKPSDDSTVYTTLKKGQELMKACGQLYHIHTFDQQLLAIAEQIKYNRPDEFGTLVLRLGAFHTLRVYISCIKKLWGDCGLRDMLAESGVYAGNTVDQMLEGNQFHRALRALKLVYEVLSHLLFENFFEWLGERNKELINDLQKKYELFYISYSKGASTKESLETLNEETNSILIPLLDEFRCIRRSESPTFLHFDNLLHSIDIVFHDIRSVREGDWDLHLHTQAAMLPYFFVCNKPNYSRYATYNFLEMVLTLPKEVENEFQAGNFSVRFTPGPFKGLWSDMGVEMSVIKDTKGDSGIIGFTRKDSTVLRWTVTRNLLGQYATSMSIRSNCNISSKLEESCKNDGPSEIARDEEDFLKMLNHVKNHMSDPFSTAIRRDFLINISTGLVASEPVNNFLLNALKIGQEKLQQFVSSRLEKQNESSKSFYAPIPQTSIKTFADLQKPTLIKFNGILSKKIICPELVYQRALVLSRTRNDVDLAIILSYPLTAVPTALYKLDGTKRVTDKSELMHALEKKVADFILPDFPLAESSPVWIIDGMAELQSLVSLSLKNFNDVGKSVLGRIVYRLKFSNEVHIIFDRYDDVTPNPKQEERMRRYGCGGNKLDISGNRPISDLKKVLSNNDNKSNLTKFICEYLRDHLPKCDIMTSSDKKVCLAGGLEPRECTYIIKQNSIIIDERFQCDHVDADTRIIFQSHCINSADQPIIVESPDTDVFILLLANYLNFQSERECWFFTGKIVNRLDHRRYIPIHILVKKLRKALITALPAAHALSGCDTTSALYFIGKKTVFSSLNKMSDDELDTLASLTELDSELTLETVSNFLAMLYDPAKNSKAVRSSINSLRYHIAVEKMVSIDRIPPSQPALTQHILRAVWQINEWNQATKATIKSKKLTSHGWVIEDDKIYTNYYEGITAMELLQKYFCSCSGKSACTTDICPCKQANLPCCDVCSCSKTCTNHSNVISDNNQ